MHKNVFGMNGVIKYIAKTIACSNSQNDIIEMVVKSAFIYDLVIIIFNFNYIFNCQSLHRHNITIKLEE